MNLRIVKSYPIIIPYLKHTCKSCNNRLTNNKMSNYPCCNCLTGDIPSEYSPIIDYNDIDRDKMGIWIEELVT